MELNEIIKEVGKNCKYFLAFSGIVLAGAVVVSAIFMIGSIAVELINSSNLFAKISGITFVSLIGLGAVVCCSYSAYQVGKEVNKNWNISERLENIKRKIRSGYERTQGENELELSSLEEGSGSN